MGKPCDVRVESVATLHRDCHICVERASSCVCVSLCACSQYDSVLMSIKLVMVTHSGTLRDRWESCEKKVFYFSGAELVE